MFFNFEHLLPAKKAWTNSADPDQTASLFAILIQGSQRLEKYLNLEGFIEKSLKIKSALKSTGK